MSIDYYVGTEGPTINVENPVELYKAIDLLHTQVMDNGVGAEEEKTVELLDKLYALMDSISEDPAFLEMDFS